jgi:hypothetical protein
MRYVKSVIATHGQDVVSLDMQPGQWIEVGNSGITEAKGVYMGLINSTDEHVFVWDTGQPRPSFRNEMKLAGMYIKASNAVKASILRKLFG